MQLAGYTTKIASLSSIEITRLRYLITNVLNVLEYISIDIENKIVNEDMCREYLWGIFTHYTRWSMPLIEDIRLKEDPQAYQHLTKRANNWKDHFLGTSSRRQPLT
jgi:hypothetical protein